MNSILTTIESLTITLENAITTPAKALLVQAAQTEAQAILTYLENYLHGLLGTTDATVDQLVAGLERNTTTSTSTVVTSVTTAPKST